MLSLTLNLDYTEPDLKHSGQKPTLHIFLFHFIPEIGIFSCSSGF